MTIITRNHDILTAEVKAHNEMADGFQELLEIMYEEHKDDK